MAIIEAEFARALESKVRRKRNATGMLRATAARVAGGAPEVMLKVTSFAQGGVRVTAHLAYITRNGRVEMETDRGDIVKGIDQVKAFSLDWAQDFHGRKATQARRDTMHLVLSMPASTPPDAVKSAARAFARHTFGGNHEYVFALHTD